MGHAVDGIPRRHPNHKWVLVVADLLVANVDRIVRDRHARSSRGLELGRGRFAIDADAEIERRLLPAVRARSRWRRPVFASRRRLRNATRSERPSRLRATASDDDQRTHQRCEDRPERVAFPHLGRVAKRLRSRSPSLARSLRSSAGKRATSATFSVATGREVMPSRKTQSKR